MVVTYLWTPKSKKCTRVVKVQFKHGLPGEYKHRGPEAKGKIRNIKHRITDYAHILPKLHCPWDDVPKNDINPGLLYHGFKSTPITERLNPPVPSHSAHPSMIDAPDEYHGRQAQDVTEMHTFMSRGKRPPSRDYYYGREATDISDHLRIIPPVAKENEVAEFFGRPKSDVTDFNRFPDRIPETASRSDAARPLGKCPPGPMADYNPLVRNKEGRLLRPQPPPLHPKSPPKRHPPENQEPLKPGGGGILSQIVEGHSRSEAKRPLGQCPPGVMADYVELKRDEHGKVITPPRLPSPPLSPPRHAGPPVPDFTANRSERLRPLGKVPKGPMADYNEVVKLPHKHTSDGFWSPPTEWPKSTSAQSSPPAKKWSPGPMTNSEAACNAADTLQGARQKLATAAQQHRSPGRRKAIVCPLHDGTGPGGVKWPKDGELEQGPCKPKCPTVNATPCSDRSKSPHGSARSCRDKSPSSICPSSVGSGERSGDGGSDNIRPDTACPRPTCECIRLSNKGSGPPSYGDVMSPPPKLPKAAKAGKPPRPGSGGSGTESVKTGSGASAASAGSKASVVSSQRRSKQRIISPITTPEHYQFPYFGHSKTYVTDPAVSPNLTPPGRRSMRLPGQENNVPCAGVPTACVPGGKMQVGCRGKGGGLAERKGNINPHLPDGKMTWFGRYKTYVTDPAVSPNLTPPNR